MRSLANGHRLRSGLIIPYDVQCRLGSVTAAEPAGTRSDGQACVAGSQFNGGIGSAGHPSIRWLSGTAFRITTTGVLTAEIRPAQSAAP